MKSIALVVVHFVALCTVVLGDEVFGPPENLALNTVAKESAPCISADNLSLYFHSDRSGGHGVDDIWVAKRRTVSDAWQQPINLGPTVNTTANEFQPRLSPDGLNLYFGSDRPGGYGGYDLWVTTQASLEGEWGTPVNLGNLVNSSAHETAPCVSVDGLHLYFSDAEYLSPRSGGLGQADLWVASRPNTLSPWGKPVNPGSVVNSNRVEINPNLSADGLMLFFTSDRDGGQGWDDIWVTATQALDGEWSVPRNLGPAVNSRYNDHYACISRDGRMLYVASGRSGGMGAVDIWQIPILSKEAFAEAFEGR